VNFLKNIRLVPLVMVTMAAMVSADQITLKDGQVVEGTIVGRANGVVTLEIAGQQIKVPETNIASMQVTMDDDFVAEPAPESTPPPPPQPKAKPVVSAGTRLTLRMAETVDTRKHKAGHRFTAKLEADLMADGIVIASRGSTVYGQVASATSSGRVAGSSELTLVFTDILVDGRMYAITTEPLSGQTGNTAKTSTKRVFRGAAIGGLVDGSDGAKTGAKVGAGAAILTGGEQVVVSAGTLLDTQFRAPFTPD